MNNDRMRDIEFIKTLKLALEGKHSESGLPRFVKGILPKGTKKLFDAGSTWYFTARTWVSPSQQKFDITIIDKEGEKHIFPWASDRTNVMSSVIILSRIVTSDMPYVGIKLIEDSDSLQKHLDLLTQGLVEDDPLLTNADLIYNAATLQYLYVWYLASLDIDNDDVKKYYSIVGDYLIRLDYNERKSVKLTPVLAEGYGTSAAAGLHINKLFESISLVRVEGVYETQFHRNNQRGILEFLSLVKLEKGHNLEIKNILDTQKTETEGYTYALPSLDQLPEPKEDVAIVSEAGAARLKEMGFNSCDGQTIDHSKFTNLHNLYDEQPNQIPETTKLTTMEKVINYIVEFKDPLYPTYANHFTPEFYAHMLFCVNEPLAQEMLNPRSRDEEGQFNKLFIAMTGAYLDELNEGKIDLDIISVFLSERDEYLGKFFDALRSLIDDAHLFARHRTMLSREPARSTRNRERSSAIYPRGLEREEDREKFRRGSHFSR